MRKLSICLHNSHGSGFETKKSQPLVNGWLSVSRFALNQPKGIKAKSEPPLGDSLFVELRQQFRTLINVTRTIGENRRM
jgi:hypothetical protein